MKFNLKNRPCFPCDEKTAKYFYKWFEGFEKELRERIKAIKHDIGNFECKEVGDVLKEILGDATKRKKSDNERAA